MIITFANSKGGVGKSTTAACLASAFVKRGERVALIDLDTNPTVSRWFADARKRPENLHISAPGTADLTIHLQTIARQFSPDRVIMDVAGLYEATLTQAVLRSSLTIIPAQPSEADLFEARRIISLLEQAYAELKRKPLYRLLLTRVPTLLSLSNVHAFKQLAKLKIPKFDCVTVQRAAYDEIGFTGIAPHFADHSRGTTMKAIEEIDRLADEIDAVHQEHLGRQRVSKGAVA